MSKVVGIFSLKEIKKSEDQKVNKVDEIKQWEKDNKKKIICNHINADNNKSGLRRENEHADKCKLCKGKVIVNPSIVNSESLKDAYELIYSGYSIVRMSKNCSKGFTQEIMSAVNTMGKLPIIFKAMEDEVKENKNKKHKNKNKKYKNFKRQ